VPADLSVVICSLNGAPGVARCLDALATQETGARLEIIVVDDGSTDGTSEVARAHRAIVVRHDVNRGVAAARNSGARAASAPVVAFLDDDCEPEPRWAQRLLGGYAAGVGGVGGVLLPRVPAGFLSGYLDRHNPLLPLELDLAGSDRLAYRFLLYLRRQWVPQQRHGERDVYSLVGANMSFRRQTLLDAGLFDERFRFGAEELDLCMRLREGCGTRLVFVPDARVVHHFAPSLSDTLRRSRAYGRGSARLYRKWPSVPPTVFPMPVAVLAALVASLRFPPALAAAVALPLVLYPRGPRDAITTRNPACLLDSYVELAKEASGNAGFAEGWWRFRHLFTEPAAAPAGPADRARAGAKLGGGESRAWTADAQTADAAPGRPL
jgi:glycosyltransferase involved in cell wall biosynthesis